jgi:hypothetical protein
MLFLRFTSNADETVSYHQIDTIQEAKIYHQQGYSLKYFKSTKSWAIELPGLCGWAVESVEDGIFLAEEEVRKSSHPYGCDFLIYTGEYAENQELCPDGDLFTPAEIIYNSRS